MLKRLLKYEILATARIFLPLYGALLALSVLNKALIFSTNNLNMPEFPMLIAMMVYVGIIVGIFVLTLIVMIQRFYKNLLSDEGYLMFTLPVRPWQLVASKLLVAMLWLIASIFVTALTIFLMTMSRSFLQDFARLFGTGLRELIQYFGFSGVAAVLEVTLFALLSIASGILMIYAAISLGHLFERRRVLASFGMYLALNVAGQTVVSILGSILKQFDFHSLEQYLENVAPSTALHFAMIPTIIWTLLCAAVYFFISNIILSKKLNLE